jgi:hypothetical protein
MKMLFTGTFWGIVLILAGISVLVKVFFHVDIPVFRIIFGIIVISFGLSILIGKPFVCTHRDSSHIVFGEGKLGRNGDQSDYNVVFGKGVTDLSGLSEKGSRRIAINTVFGENTVYISPDVPVHIIVNTVFAGAVLPDGNTAAMGTFHYRSPNLEKASEHLTIEANVVFGSMRILHVKP